MYTNPSTLHHYTFYITPLHCIILLFPTSSFTLTEFCMFSISQESFDLVVWEHIAFKKLSGCTSILVACWYQQLRTVSKHVDGFHVGLLPRCEIAFRIYEHFYISKFLHDIGGRRELSPLAAPPLLRQCLLLVLSLS